MTSKRHHIMLMVLALLLTLTSGCILDGEGPEELPEDEPEELPEDEREEVSREGENGEMPVLVSAEWLVERIDAPELRIIDMRDESDYLEGHIKNALHLDRRKIQAEVDGVTGMLAPQEKLAAVFGELGDNSRNLGGDL